MATEQLGAAASASTELVRVADVPGAIPNDAITNAKLNNMAQATIKGRAAGGGTGDPDDLSAANVLTILSANGDDWTSYTPTWTNLTIGNATVVVKYFQIGRLVALEYTMTWGSGTSYTGGGAAIAMSVPVLPAVTGYGTAMIQYRDVSPGASHWGFGLMGASAISFFRANIAGANDILVGVTGTAPFTWATGDILVGTAMYRSAS